MKNKIVNIIKKWCYRNFSNEWIEGIEEKVWFIDTENNWKLKIANRYNYASDEPFFKSKKKALQFVLEWAKEKLKPGTRFDQLHDSFGDDWQIVKELELEKDLKKESYIYNNIGTGDGWVVWEEKKGWIAKSVKTYTKTNEGIEKKEFTESDMIEFSQYYTAEIVLWQDEKSDVEILLNEWLKQRNESQRFL